MTEQKNQLASLFAACWKDEALKARFMADPKAVLAEHGMDVPDGMVAEIIDPMPIGGVATTPVVASGETFDAIVRFRFLDGSDGSQTLTLIATSVNEPTISATGEATYLVGRQGTIDLVPPTPAVIEVSDSSFVYTMDIEVKNKLNPAVSPSQSITIDKVDGNWSSYISVRINTNDRSFSLASDASNGQVS